MEYIIDKHKVLVDDDVILIPIEYGIKKSRNTFYVYRKRDSQFLHHIIIGKHPTLYVDHKDRNGLNNQRNNLHHVSRAYNTINSDAYEMYKGIYKCSHSGKWYARIKDGPKRRNLGAFTSQEDAIKAYKVEQAKLLDRARGGT